MLGQLAINHVGLLVKINMVLTQAVNQAPQPVIQVVSHVFRHDADHMLMSQTSQMLSCQIAALIVIDQKSVPAIGLVLVEQQIRNIIWL